MSWQPPPRPAWVASINAGENPLIEAEASLPFERDALLETARARLGVADRGLADFGCKGFELEPFLEGLDVLLPALEEEAALTHIGRYLMRRFLLRILEVRLQILAYLRADPGVRDEEITAPLVVAGAPRTGTTILFDLLAADPAHRAPLGWELLRPVPPPGPDAARRACDARVELAEQELVLPQTVVSGLRQAHVYGALRPKECLSAMSFAMRSEEFSARCRVPSYAAWLARCDLAPAYQMHRLVLQILQRGCPRTRWVLKSPVHLHSLPALFATYPDARVAVTHRDPLVMLASLTSLIANLRWAHSDAVDYAELGREHAERYEVSLDRLASWCRDGTLPPAQLHHSHFADFRTDALAVVEGLYARFGLPIDGSLRAHLRATLAAPHDTEPGGHRYDFESLGLDRAHWRAAFGNYQTAFAVPSE
jgi:hypothetical protein